MKKALHFINKQALLWCLFLISGVMWGQTYYDMSTANYSQNFDGINTLPTNFSTVAVLNIGSIPVATKTTTASLSSLSVVGSAAAIGIDASTSTSLVFLTTGGSDNSTATATDLNLNFTNRAAGNLSYDIATISNGSGNRAGSLRVYYSLNNTSWTELTGTNLPYLATNNVTGSGTVNILLPSALNNIGTVKLRFYYHNGSGGTTGSRPRIGMDNLSVTSIPLSSVDPLLSISGTLSHGSSCNNTAASPIIYTITNTGQTAATGISVVSSGTNSGDFVVSGLSSTTIAASGGTATYNVTFTPSATGSRSATITVASGTSGSNSPTTALTGTGSNTALTLTTPTSATITATSATLGGNITIAGCSPITERGIYYSTTSGFANGTGTKVSATGTFSTGVFTINTSPLSSGTLYYYKAFATSNGVNAYSSEGSFTTPTLPVTVPYSQNFEGTTNEWTLETTGTNKWAIGSATNNGGTKALYISNDGGTTNAYTLTSTQNGTNASVRVDLTSLANATLSFDWKSNGELFQGDVYDFGEVYLNKGGADILISSANEFYNTTTFGIKTIDLTAHVGQIVTLKFKWVNDSSAGNQPPFAVDNVSIVPSGLPVFTTAAITANTYNSATSGGTITNNGGSAITARGIVYSTSPSPTIDSNLVNSGSGNGTYVSNLTGLLSNTTYYVRAFVTNSNSSTFYANELSFTTTVISAPIATAATAVASTSFTANWNAVVGATSGYLLDVSTSPNFGTSSLTEITEGFENGLSNSSYQTTDLTLDSGVWSVVNVRSGTTGINSGTYSAQLQSATGSALISPSFANGISAINFWVTSSTATGAIQVNYSTDGGQNWIAASNSPFTGLGTTKSQKTVTINSNTPTLIQILRTGATIYIDDIVISSSGLTPSFVAGYNAKPIAGQATITSPVTGLTPETQYYYRLRSKDANSTSVNSNVISVMTTSLPAITWNGTAWSNTTGPTALLDAVIAENYNETANIIAKNLTINTGKVLTVKPTSTLKVAGNLTNDGSIVFKSDATGTASFASYTGAAIAGSGTSTVERYIPAKRAWRTLTAPLQGSDASLYATWQNNGTVSTGTGVEIWGPAGTGMAVGPSYSALEYTSSGYVNVINTQTKNLFETNKNNAYLIFVTGGYGSGNIANTVPAESTTLKATGKLITGNVTRSDIIDARHTMIGNPYASPMSPASLLTNSTNLINKFWVWDSNLAGTGGYVMYDPTAGTYSNNAGSYTSSSTAIQSGQAFYVRAITGSTGSLTLTENNKSGTMTNAVFSNDTPEIFRISMYRQQSTDWLPVDGAIAAMYQSANPEVDVNDGRKFVNSFENIAFRKSNTSLSSEHLLPPVAQDTLYFRVWNTTPNTYKLHLNTESFTTTGLIATLQDLYTNTNTVLNLDGSVNEYLFDVTTNVASANDRFRIVFSTDENLAISPNTKSPFVVAPNPVTNQLVTIYSQDDQFKNLKYMLVNALGQVVSKGNVNANKTINVANIAAGVYIMKLQTENNAVYTSKLIIK